MHHVDFQLLVTHSFFQMSLILIHIYNPIFINLYEMYHNIFFFLFFYDLPRKWLKNWIFYDVTERHGLSPEEHHGKKVTWLYFNGILRSYIVVDIRSIYQDNKPFRFLLFVLNDQQSNWRVYTITVDQG